MKLVGVIVAGLMVLLLSCAGCAHDPCRAVEQDAVIKALNDAAQVYACTAQGAPLKACEEQQLAQQISGLTPDALVCGENALAAAVTNGQHADGGQ